MVKRRLSVGTSRFGKKARRFSTRRMKRYNKGSLSLARAGRMSLNVHSYKRHCESLRLNVEGDGTSTFFGYGLNFMLSELPSYSEFVNLYDQYKISCVVVKIQMLNIPELDKAGCADTANTNSGTSNLTQLYPKFWYYTDYDDSQPPASLAEMQQVGKVKCFILRPNKIYTFKIRPALPRTIQGSVAEPSWPKRLDCSQPTLVHYGFKYGIDTMGQKTPDTVFWKFQIDRLYYLKFFNTR